MVDAVVEDEGQRHPDGAPGAGLLERHLMGIPVEDAEVDRQHDEHECVEADPQPELLHVPILQGSSATMPNARRASPSRAPGTMPGECEGLAQSAASATCRTVRVAQS